MLLTFGKLGQPVRLTGCDDVADGIAAILRGWDVRETAPGGTAPRIRIRRTRKGYRCVSPLLAKPSLCRGEGFRRDATGATCILHSQLIKWYLEANRDLLCLHCGAVELADGLVIFAGPYKAGKSTLSVQLAAAGARLFCDDVLLIEPDGNLGVAPGFAPRLRLPLPETDDPAFAEFVAAREGPRNKGHVYVRLRAGELAPLGASAPIRGIVALDRDGEAAPMLAAADRSDILKRVIMRNIARDVAALDVLDRFMAIVNDARCFTLRYGDGGDAAELLFREFGGAPAREAAA